MQAIKYYINCLKDNKSDEDIYSIRVASNGITDYKNVLRKIDQLVPYTTSGQVQPG